MASIQIFPLVSRDGSVDVISADLYSNTTGFLFMVDVTVATEGQSVQLQMVCKDGLNHSYLYGPAMPAISATGQYAYVVHPAVTTTGGSIPPNGITALPMPGNFNLQLVFSDSSGDLPMTLSVYGNPLV